MRIAGIAVLAGLLAPAISVSDPWPGPFTVKDGIEMTRVNSGVGRYDSQSSSGVFYTAPDGNATLTVIRRGNLATARNEYQLVLFDADETRRFVNADIKTPPRMRVMAEFATGAATYGIEHVKWQPDSRTVLFIGRGVDEKGQVYSLDVTSGWLRAITRHPEDVVSFDATPDGRRWIYSAYAPVEDWTARNARGYVLTSHTWRNMTLIDPSLAAPRYMQQYVLDDSEDVRETALPRDIYAQAVWFSPTGRWAVSRVQVKGYPAQWREYEFIDRELEAINRIHGAAAAALDVDDDYVFSAFPSFTISQFYLIDVSTGDARPLLDAPVLAFTFFKALWSKDESRVLLAPTFLPLAGVEPQEETRRKRIPAVVEVDVATGAARRIMDVPDDTTLTAVDELADDSVEIRVLASAASEAVVRRFVRADGVWLENRSPRRHRGQAQGKGGLTFSVVEDMNTPPQIVAHDDRTGRRKVLTDLNPQFRGLTLGHVELFNWSDRLKRNHVGGLVHPPDYHADTRYPIVIQTYGFSPARFLVDGPLASKAAFAAQALANKGMLVLQMPDVSSADQPPGPYEDTGENPRFIAMLESAIDELDTRGLIQKDRVGLVGFSRSGMHVMSAITFSDYPIAAATSADSIADTPLSYVAMFGLPSAAMTEWERPVQMGAPFWGDGIKLWMARSTAFHLDRIRTPLRLESYATGVDPRWDTYAMLKRFRRPVEFFQLPKARHILTNPVHVYASQQGNVDWYAFWLKGEEDPDPAKAEQYARWRKLRAQHEAHLVDLGEQVGTGPALPSVARAPQ